MTEGNLADVNYGVYDAFSDIRKNRSIGWGITTDGDWVWEGGQPVVTGMFHSKTHLRGYSIIWGLRKA
jgi:urocanate hydratase